MIPAILSGGSKPDAPSVVTGATKLGTVAATGGTKTTITSGGTQYSLHTFTGTTSITFSSGGPVEYLIIGGGGGAGAGYTGAGAGGIIQGTTTVTAGTYTVTVGSGGNGAESFGASATNGQSSSVFSQSAAGGLTSGNSGNGYTPGASQQSGYNNVISGGGAGNAANGNAGSYPTTGGSGGSGTDVSTFLGQSAGTTYKGGGGGGSGWWAIDWGGPQVQGGAGGVGGGGTSPGVGSTGGGYVIPSSARGAANSGGGGATAAGRQGIPFDDGARGANGGSGIVYVRYALSSQTTAEVSFVEPTYKGKTGTARYRVTSNTNVSTEGDTPPIEVTGLTPGNNYNFTVKTLTPYGAESDSSTVSNTFQLGIAPGAPTIGTATAGTTVGTANSASVTFTPGTSGTGTTTYTATSIPGGLTASNQTGATLVVTGLTAGTSYTFTVSASNSFGSNASGQSNSVIAYGTPNAPTLNSVNAEYSRANLSWTAPTTGYPTNYTYTAYAVASGYPTRSATTSGTSVQISSLSNYVTYTFYVTATNSIGTSSNSNSLTEYTDVPCVAGTYLYGPNCQTGGGYPSFGGATCCYTFYCNGDGGISQVFTSGDCQVTCSGTVLGPYCAGCTPCIS
jgi:hypothetical protein